MRPCTRRIASAENIIKATSLDDLLVEHAPWCRTAPAALQIHIKPPGGFLMHGYAKDKDLIVKRLHRIEGQVRGIERMVDEDRYCIDILTQIAAVETALEQVGARLLEDHVTHCVRDAIASGDETAADEKTAELLTAVQRFVKTR